MKKFYPKGNDGKPGKPSAAKGIAPNQLIAKRYLTKFEIRLDAMINVHMAFDRERDMNVSLMAIPPEILKNPDLLADLKLELSAASKLNHNNICRLYSIDTWNKMAFTVMEYVPGQTLAAHLAEKGGKLDLDETITLLRQIANGLDFAHTQPTPLSHLGIKPQNILLTEDKLVKIADFGIANILSSPAARLPGRENPETLSYRAPEQISGNETGAFTDIYSVALVAYEMLAGKTPFQEEDLRGQIVNPNIPKIEGVPDHVNDALLLALSKEASDRPGSAGDLVAMIAGEKPIPKKKKKKKAASDSGETKKKPILLFGAIAALLLLIIGGVSYFISTTPTKKPPAKPPKEAAVTPKVAAVKAEKPKPVVPRAAVETPAPQPKAAAKTIPAPTGKASIASVPDEADVFINGLKKGLTPVVIKQLEAGDYEVAVKKDGFETYNEKITIAADGVAEVTAMLKPIYGALKINSTPPNAEVFLDGVSSGVTPITLGQVKKGTRQIRLAKPGYDTWTKTIPVEAGVQKDLAATLKVSMGSINITSNPANATIYISGIKNGKTPLMLKVEKGLRKVEIKKSGYETWVQNVKVLAGDMISVKAKLIASKGGLQIDSRPEDAAVYISGKKVGSTPLHLKEIKNGKVTVEIRKDCYKSASQTISITSGKLSKVLLDLQPRCGKIAIKSRPAGAKWYIDDKFMGNTPGTIESVESGKHKIKVSKDQFLDWRATFTIEPGRTKSITAKLKQALPDPGATWREPITGIEFIWIAQGCYKMGSDPNALGRSDDEGPVHKVCVDGFWMSKNEVTQGQWQKVMGTNPSFFKRKQNYPVDSVSWNDTQLFIKRLSDLSKGKFLFRLPTEAEWEFACRSGGQKERFSGGERFNSVAWHRRNSNRTTHSVGDKVPNNVGLFDMSGNLSEWVADAYAADAYRKHAEKNPKYDKKLSNRVIRGGNWNEDENNCRCMDREYAPADEGRKTIGVRLIKIH